MFDTIKKLRYILPEKDPIKIGVLFIMMMTAALLEVIGIGMIPAFVAIVAAPDRVLEFAPLLPIFEYLNITGAEDLLVWGSIGLVGVFIIKSLYVVTFNYFEARFIYNRRYTISHRMINAYMYAPYTFFLQRNTSELIRNITGEVNILVSSVLTNILKIAREAVMTISILLFLLYLEPLITLMVILISGLGAGTFLLITQKKVKRYGLQEQEHRRSMIKTALQALLGIKDTRVLNREQDFIEKFRVEAYLSTRLKAYIKYIQQIPKPVVETSAVVGMMLIAGLMVWQGRPMSSIIPILTLFAMATVRLMPAVNQLSSLYTNLMYNLVSIDPIYSDLKELEQGQGTFLDDRKKGERLVLKDSIKANDVHYVYPNSEEQALKGVSFTIPRTGSVAFVGESGAGKTTVVDLLLGLLEPTEGEICVDGKNINKNLSSWQRNIGYIPQSIYLADETLRFNIAFGIPEKEVDDEKVKQAVESAQLSELVESLPLGLNTIVGEHGTRLSGGQRQRVGIARALYHQPEVLVMDEATSALDNITEKHVVNAIEELKGERTIIMIAHRLTTVMNCDMLYLMEDGKIVQQGTYSELIETNVRFKEMAMET